LRLKACVYLGIAAMHERR